MQKEQIFVFGQGNVAPAVLEHSRQHTLITAGVQKHNNIANFVCVNEAKQLDELMLNKAKAIVLAPRNIYAKYAFFKGIECLPYFEDLINYKWDSHLVSQQLLCVALAAWMGANAVILGGYVMDDKKEQENLQALMTLYPDIEFVLVSRDSVRLDGIKSKNFTAMDQPQYKQRMRSNG
jgi:hypothetical protein